MSKSAAAKKDYDAADWFWQVGADETRVWSVGENRYVPVADIAAWRSEGGVPAYVDDEAALEAYLASIGLSGPRSAAPEAVIERFRGAIQAHVDTTAQSRNYGDGNSLASYVASTNVTWAAEATAFVAWRDAVWIYAYAELDKVTAGEREVPTVEAFIGELPVMVWPEKEGK